MKFVILKSAYFIKFKNKHLFVTVEGNAFVNIGNSNNETCCRSNVLILMKKCAYSSATTFTYAFFYLATNHNKTIKWLHKAFSKKGFTER